MKRKLAFLSRKKQKTLRTVLYGDSQFYPFEIEILHTPVFQRLYGLKQLGFADKVYPDAVHSRFNHVLGVCHKVQQMATELQRWLKENPSEVFRYDGSQLTGSELASRVEQNTFSVRLVGLLHDLTHAAYGHTLEDEICVFEEKHDDPSRQARFLNCLVGQLIWNWAHELGLDNGEPDPELLDRLNRSEPSQLEISAWVEFIRTNITQGEREVLSQCLRALEFACCLLFKLDALHRLKDSSKAEQHLAKVLERPPQTILPQVLRSLDGSYSGADFNLHRDAIFIDMVGNTICSDLLDYARRDPYFSGVCADFDDRILKYLVAASASGEYSPTSKPCIRLAVQFFTNKMRYDVLSEMSKILKARYLISENILWHPTKCAAGAMLGSVIQLLGLTNLPTWIQILGDGDFRFVLDLTAKNLAVLIQSVRNMGGLLPDDEKIEVTIGKLWPHDIDSKELVSRAVRGLLGQREVLLSDFAGQLSQIETRVRAARVVLWNISSRRFPTLVFRLRSQVTHSEKEGAKAIAERYNNMTRRYELERDVERSCGLPIGSVFVHCPPRKTSMKVAEALVVGPDINNVALLRELTKVAGEQLRPYQDEIVAIERMYESIWTFHVYIASAHLDKALLAGSILHRRIDYPNDDLLVKELTSDAENVYDLLATEFENEVAFNDLPSVVIELDRLKHEFLKKHRKNEKKSGARELVQQAIRAVALAKAEETETGQAGRLTRLETFAYRRMPEQLPLQQIPPAPPLGGDVPLVTVDEILTFAAIFGADKMPSEQVAQLSTGIQEFLPVPNQDATGYDRRRRYRLRKLLSEMQEIDPKKNRLLLPKEILNLLNKLWRQTEKEN